jgi:acyl-CoA thioester hydrolase
MSASPDSPEPLGWFCLEDTTRPEWLDENRHVNVQYYFRLVARAMSDLMERVLRGGTRPNPAPLFFSLEMNIQYFAELMAGQRVRVYARPISRSEKVVRVLVRIYRAEGEPVLSADCDWKGAYVDPTTRRVAPLDPLAKEIFDAKLAEANGEILEPKVFPPGLVLPPPLAGKEIVSAEGFVQSDWIDQMGHMNIEYYMHIFNRAAGGYFSALGFGHEMMRRHRWGAFGMGSRVKYLREMKQGERYITKTAATSLQRKTVTYRHTIYAADGKTECATCDHSSLFVDWETRKSIPLPEQFKTKIAEVHGLQAASLV